MRHAERGRFCSVATLLPEGPKAPAPAWRTRSLASPALGLAGCCIWAKALVGHADDRARPGLSERRPSNRPMPRWPETKAVVRGGAYRRSLLGDCAVA